MSVLCRSLLPCLLAISFSGFSQVNDSLRLITWNKKPAVHAIDSRYSSESAVVLSELRRIEYIDYEGKVQEFRTIHKLVHVNDDRGIEMFNRIYLEVNDSNDIRDLRARTILSNGKIIEIDKSRIKDIREHDRSYKIFAMEGVEKNAEVEYYYTYKIPTVFFGREVLQATIPVIKSDVEVLAPDRLVFDIKSFNGAEKYTDSVYNGKRVLKVSLQNIAGAEDEIYSAYDASLKRIEFKLSYNKSTNPDVRLFTWNELAKLLFEAYGTYTDREMRKTDDLIRKEHWNDLNNDTDRIVAVENYLKKNIGTRDDISGNKADDIEEILKINIASNRGMIRLFGAIFERLKLPHEFVLCGARDAYELDRTFENWNNANNALIYFPGLKKYVCPTSVETRYPWINPMWGETTGLYCKPTVIGNYSTAIAVIKPIMLEPYDQTQNNTEIRAKLNPQMDTLLVQTVESFSGYSSVYYRSSYNLSSREDQEQMLKQMIKSATQTDHIISSAIRNPEFDNSGKNKPFIMEASVKAGELVEKAGNKTLIKLGELIGPQTQIYNDKDRRFPISLGYPHVMNRRIALEIPEGYYITNLNDLNITSLFKENGEQTMGFVSSYHLENNTVIIDVIEDYRRVNYPLSQYPDFKKIINASADFNKVTLALVKK